MDSFCWKGRWNGSSIGRSPLFLMQNLNVRKRSKNEPEGHKKSATRNTSVCACWCPERESNPHGHYWPQDFRTSYSFCCSRLGRDLWSGLSLRLAFRFRRLPSSLYTLSRLLGNLARDCQFQIWKKVSPNLRGSTSQISLGALKFYLSPACLPIPPPGQVVVLYR